MHDKERILLAGAYFGDNPLLGDSLEAISLSLALQRYASPNHTPESHFAVITLQKYLSLSDGEIIKVSSTSPFQLLNIFKLFSLHALKMASITPFKISISEDKIKRLQQKLALTNLPSEVLDPTNLWSRGVPLS
jgi:hypothetical protein